MAQIVANLQWRLKRIKPIEDGLLNMHRCGSTDPSALPESGRDCEDIADAFMNHGRSLANLSSYEHRLYRNMKDALNKVEALKAERERREDEEAQAVHNKALKDWFLSPYWPSHGPPADPVVEAPPASVQEPQVGSAAKGQALSSPACDQRREPLVSGFVFPKNEIAPETDQIAPMDRLEQPPPGENSQRLDEKEAA